MKRKRNGRRLSPAAPKTNRVKGAYQFPHFLQPLSNGTNGEVKFCDPFHQQDEMRCVCCRKRISNRSLGGFDGKSAMSGRLWCLSCC